MKKLILASTLLFAANMANANIVVNGSFEDTNQPSGSWAIYNEINGWVAADGDAGIEVRNNVQGTASDGVNFVELDSRSNSAMAQTLDTVAGQMYEILFDYSPRINQPESTNGIEAYWNDEYLGFAADQGGSINLWTTYSVLVTALGQDQLIFAAIGTSDSFGGNIDNVRVNAVPVPAALPLMASALGMFGVARRRKTA